MDTLSLLRSGQLAGCTRLDLSCDLTELPQEVFNLADSLEVLNLTGNQLCTLPADLPRLHKLRVLFCSHNQFTHLPAVVGECTSLSMVGFRENQIETINENAFPPELRWLILTGNRLTQIPASIGRCHRLQKLMLSANQLSSLTEELSQCENLEMIRLGANEFSYLPDWLLAMPKLSWLALAGNPITRYYPSNNCVPEIPWSELTLQQKLGEGASGTIYRADWNSSKSSDPIASAVKIFKGEVTSDGLPECEMAACMAAGSHPSLTETYGRVVGHPENANGLVMKLIPPEFKNLAGPPSLESCTRDVYAADFSLTASLLVKMCRSLASAMSQLHAAGMMHGDFYAHNIVWTAEGDCYLGDFGAAAFYPLQDARIAIPMQAFEVRAFGYLVEELLQHITDLPQDSDTLKRLNDLVSRCLSDAVSSRPTFADVETELEKITQI